MYIKIVTPIRFYMVTPAAEASEHFVSSAASRSGVYFLRRQLFFTSVEWETEFRPERTTACMCWHVALDAHHVTRRVEGHGHATPRGKLPRSVGLTSRVHLENKRNIICLEKDEQNPIGKISKTSQRNKFNIYFPAEHRWWWRLANRRRLIQHQLGLQSLPVFLTLLLGLWGHLKRQQWFRDAHWLLCWLKPLKIRVQVIRGQLAVTLIFKWIISCLSPIPHPQSKARESTSGQLMSFGNFSFFSDIMEEAVRQINGNRFFGWCGSLLLLDVNGSAEARSLSVCNLSVTPVLSCSMVKDQLHPRMKGKKSFTVTSSLSHLFQRSLWLVLWKQ